VSSDTLALVDALDAGEAHLLGDEMRSTILGHGRRTARVLVLLHGMTASPRTWRDFAQARHARGETVLIPRLPRHGHADRMTNALRHLTVDELRAQGHRIISTAAALGDEIVVVGFSMGGVLALHLAQHEPRVARTIAISPLLGIRFVPAAWLRPLRALLLRWRHRFLWWNPFDRGRTDPKHGYPRYALGALGAGLALAEELFAAARSAPPAGASVELVQNAGETSVNNAAIDRLVARWRRAGAHGVRVLRLVGLGVSHDVIEPEWKRAPAVRFLPQLHALLDNPPAEADTVLDARR
jgi:carboxylesterase